MKRKILITAVIMCLAAVTIGGTFAYFTAESPVYHNVITTGGIDVEVREWGDPEKTEPFKDIEGAMPGGLYTKIVEIVNTGDGAAYVRAAVDIQIRDTASPSEALDPSVLTVDFNLTDWAKVEDGEKTYYVYRKELQPGESTAPLFSAVTFAGKEMGNIYQRAKAEIDVKAYAVQSRNNGTDPFTAKGWPKD